MRVAAGADLDCALRTWPAPPGPPLLGRNRASVFAPDAGDHTGVRACYLEFGHEPLTLVSVCGDGWLRLERRSLRCCSRRILIGQPASVVAWLGSDRLCGNWTVSDGSGKFSELRGKTDWCIAFGAPATAQESSLRSATEARLAELAPRRGWRSVHVGARDVLLAHRGGPWAVPNLAQHPRTYPRDSAFHIFATVALGELHLARNQLSWVLLDCAHRNGRISTCQASKKVNSLPQPPLYARAAEDAKVDDPRVFAALTRYLDYMTDAHATERPPLLRWKPGAVHNAYDNHPRYADGGGVSASFDLCAHMIEELGAMHRLTGGRAWKRRRDLLANAVERQMWSNRLQTYTDLGADGALIEEPDAMGFLGAGFTGRPLALRATARAYLNRTRGRVWSVDPSLPAFGRDMWRGPLWAPQAFLTARAFRNAGWVAETERVQEAFTAEVERWFKATATFFEYYHPPHDPRDLPRKCQGSGGGPRDMDWTAAVLLSWI